MNAREAYQKAQEAITEMQFKEFTNICTQLDLIIEQAVKNGEFRIKFKADSKISEFNRAEIEQKYKADGFSVSFDSDLKTVRIGWYEWICASSA